MRPAAIHSHLFDFEQIDLNANWFESKEEQNRIGKTNRLICHTLIFFLSLQIKLHLNDALHRLLHVQVCVRTLFNQISCNFNACVSLGFFLGYTIFPFLSILNWSILGCVSVRLSFGDFIPDFCRLVFSLFMSRSIFTSNYTSCWCCRSGGGCIRVFAHLWFNVFSLVLPIFVV